jgi:hypothetical protein
VVSIFELQGGLILRVITEFMSILNFEEVVHPVVLTGLFWSSSTLMQRATGIVNMHAGRAYPVTVCWGIACTGLSMMLAQYNTDGVVRALVNANIPILSSAISNKGWSHFWGKSRSSGNGVNDAKVWLVGMAGYSLLERRGFRTALPSSLLTVGAYAPNPLLHIFTRGIATINPIATSAQRYMMQRLGAVHGCHHCGTRQILNRKSFIADHMPPTKIALQINSRWYRRWLSWPLKQQLLPQCQSCFSQQGSAVRASIHTIVYGMPLRIWHFAPALAYFALEKNLLCDYIDDMVNSAVRTSVAETVAKHTTIILKWFH